MLDIERRHPKLYRTLTRRNRERGEAFFTELPSKLARLATRWELEIGEPFGDLSYHYVCRATRADGGPAVVKMGLPHDEQRTEAEALRYLDGRGAIRLLEEDLAEGALLLERVEPGETLVQLSREDDDAATLTGAAMMRELWRPAPERHGLRDMQSWFKFLWAVDRWFGMKRLERPATLGRAVPLARELIASTIDPVLLHGDLHHFNILSARRAPWLAIDPKGHVGDRCYELFAFLLNPDETPAARLTRRLDILTSELGLDRERARDWCFVRQVLNACWSLDDAEEFRRDLELAEELAVI